MAALAYSSRTRINGALGSVCITPQLRFQALQPLFSFAPLRLFQFFDLNFTSVQTHFRHHIFSSIKVDPPQHGLNVLYQNFYFISLPSKDLSDSIFTTMCINITDCLYKCANRILCCESQLKYTPIRKCHHSTQCNICRSVNLHAKFELTS